MDLNKIKDRLRVYKTWAQAPIDSELVKLAQINSQKLNTVMQTV